MFGALNLLALTQAVQATYTTNTFDYVIVGGGPAGLVLAKRLSSHPDITVAVIEAGDSAINNPNVTNLPRSIAEFGAGLGTSVDWAYKSAPQKYASNLTLRYSAGKALGGTTTINGMTYLRAEKEQIDAWEELGNPGWNWESLWKYYLTQEHFQIPTSKQQSDGATYNEEAHGSEGELDVGFNPYLVSQGAFEIIRKTSEAAGYPFNPDANSGEMRGTTTWPMMVDNTAVKREDAARAFYYPIAESRSNLHIFLNTTATRIVWSEKGSSDCGVVATGIEVVTSDNSTDIIHAAKEVILSAGSIRSPALLEQSGIGNPAILETFGVETIVPLLAVGSNLQDQPQAGVVYASTTNWTGYPTFVTYLTASELFGDDVDAVANEVYANLSTYATTILEDYASNAVSLEAQTYLLKQQADLIFSPNSTVSLAELLWAPFDNTIIIQSWNLLPFSRGSIHIASANPTAAPSIDPNFFQLPIDVAIQAAILVRIRELFAMPPLSEHVTVELTPGFEAVPQNATWRDEAWSSWMKKSYGTNTHPVSVCAMMSEELGGVVDAEGKVYGTENVRVVDASVFPTQISGHLSASVYAIAGRIADVILGET